MAYGIQFNTSAGTKNISSITDVGLRLHYAIQVTPSYGSTVVQNPRWGSTPSTSGTISVPTFDSTLSGALIFSFLDESQPHFFGNDYVGGNYPWGMWLNELDLSWNNTTKQLSYSLQKNTYGNISTSPYIGTYNIWFLYGG